MDDGAKALIFLFGGGALVAAGWLLFRRLFGAPKALDPGENPASDAGTRDHTDNY